MPARDAYHPIVRTALIADGWTITHDPLVLKWGLRDLFVDLGAERLITAAKGDRQIAVEIKGFGGPSPITDLERAVGQFTLYRDVMAEREPGRELYLAVPEEVVGDLFEEPVGQLLLQNDRVRLLVFDPLREVIVRWLPPTPTERSSSTS